MDLEKALSKIKELEGTVANLTRENAEFKESNTKLGEDLKAKDTEISTLKTQAGERAQQFKKLKDMTDAEKELLSEKEKDILLRQEKLEEDYLKLQTAQTDHQKKIKTSIIDNLAVKFAKGDKDLTEQIKINLSKLSPELLEKATTEQELTPLVQDALNMTGVAVVSGNDNLRQAINTDGLPAKIEGEKDFADTKEGQDLGKAMGLSSFTSDNNNK